MRSGGIPLRPRPVSSAREITRVEFRVFFCSRTEESMRQHWAATVVAVITAALLVGDTVVERSVAAQQSSRGSSVTAVPGAVGFLDPTGPYEVVQGWPKDLSTLPGNERWTFGAGQGVFAESPDRVYYI